jgi:hypothetical protein
MRPEQAADSPQHGLDFVRLSRWSTENPIRDPQKHQTNRYARHEITARLGRFRLYRTAASPRASATSSITNLLRASFGSRASALSA